MVRCFNSKNYLTVKGIVREKGKKLHIKDEDINAYLKDLLDQYDKEEAVKRDCGVLALIPENEQSLEMCLNGVRQNPDIISSCGIQNEEICLTVVRKKGSLLGQCKIQNEEICYEAILNDCNAVYACDPKNLSERSYYLVVCKRPKYFWKIPVGKASKRIWFEYLKHYPCDYLKCPYKNELIEDLLDFDHKFVKYMIEIPYEKHLELIMNHGGDTFVSGTLVGPVPKLDLEFERAKIMAYLIYVTRNSHLFNDEARKLVLEFLNTNLYSVYTKNASEL